MAMDIIKITLTIFLLSTGGADSQGTECPSNTVEIVFTKNGVICATTSSIPELNHLSVDPKHIQNLLGEPPIMQKVSVPVLTHPLVNAPPPPQHMIVQQMPVPQMSPDLAMLGQPIPVQSMMAQPLVADYMARRLPLYHENLINQNVDYIDRRPDLIEDKRLYYQKMLWEKLRRDAFIKKLVRNNPNQLFGVQYADDNQNKFNDVPEQDKTSEEQPQNLPQLSDNTQAIEENTETDQRQSEQSAQPAQEGQTISDDQSNNSDISNNNNDYNDNQSQEQIGLDENQNGKEDALKNYLKYLNKNDDNPLEHQNSESARDGRQYDMGSPIANSKVPDIITGYIPEETYQETNEPTFGMKIQKFSEDSEEPAVSQSQVSYQVQMPDSRLYNQNLMQTLRFPQTENSDQSMRLVTTGLNFGHRINIKEMNQKPFGYDFKSYPEYNEEKAKKFRSRTHLNLPPNFNMGPIQEDVVLVTADPNQRQIIETLEASQQNSRRNQRKFANDWTGSQGLSENNAVDYQLNKNFQVDKSRIEYNGWRPLKMMDKAVEQPEDRPAEDELKSGSSLIVTSILPITGRANNNNNNWKAI